MKFVADMAIVLVEAGELAAEQYRVMLECEVDRILVSPTVVVKDTHGDILGCREMGKWEWDV